MAVLGILLANIEAFAEPTMAAAAGFYEPFRSQAEGWFESIRLALVSGKFRTMLAILFGVGIWLQFLKRSPVSGSWPGGYLKRTFFLGLFGAIHGFLIWHGDILLMYSFLAVAACLMAQVETEKLKVIVWVLSLLTVLMALGFGLLLLTFPEIMREQATLAGVPSPSAETEIYARSGYGEQLAARASFFVMGLTGTLMVLGPGLLSLFLLGILMARNGVLGAPSEHPGTRNAALLAGFGLGLPLNLLAVNFVNRGGFNGLDLVWEMAFGPLLSVGYLMLLAVLAEKGLGWLQRLVSNVGRMALSCYILQSILGVFVFYSFGFGLFGKLDDFQQLAVVAGIWAVDVLFATLWLRRFDIGPLEWALRSLTEGRKMPWKYEKPKAPEFVL